MTTSRDVRELLEAYQARVLAEVEAQVKAMLDSDDPEQEIAKALLDFDEPYVGDDGEVVDPVVDRVLGDNAKQAKPDLVLEDGTELTADQARAILENWDGPVTPFQFAGQQEAAGTIEELDRAWQQMNADAKADERRRVSESLQEQAAMRGPQRLGSYSYEEGTPNG
jgi:hypothetical protein